MGGIAHLSQELGNFLSSYKFCKQGYHYQINHLGADCGCVSTVTGAAALCRGFWQFLSSCPAGICIPSFPTFHLYIPCTSKSTNLPDQLFYPTFAKGLKLWGQSYSCAISTLIERFKRSRLHLPSSLKFATPVPQPIYFSLRFLFYFQTITFHKAPVLTLTRSNPKPCRTFTGADQTRQFLTVCALLSVKFHSNYL